MSNGSSWPGTAWPSASSNAPWPSPYRADTDPSANAEPRLQRSTILALAPQIVAAFLNDDQSFGQQYGDLVAQYRAGAKADKSQDFLQLLGDALDTDALKGANEHDFANLHRSAWLLMLHGLTRVLNFNLHRDWGDPAGGAGSQGRYDDADGSQGGFYLLHFHTTPNSTGSYAIGTSDLPPPDVGIGEGTSSTQTRNVPPDSLTLEQIKALARGAGRKIVTPAPAAVKRSAGARSIAKNTYHEIVKSYYRDRNNHTLEYANEIGSMVPTRDEQLRSAIAGMGDNDVANVHRGVWLFLAHRFSYVVGENPFGGYADVDPRNPQHEVPLPGAVGGDRTFEIPNNVGAFYVNRVDIDPDPDP
jgi:hypothetical protein